MDADTLSWLGVGIIWGWYVRDLVLNWRGARTNAPNPQQAPDVLLEAINKVRFDKAMVGDGFDARRLLRASQDGKIPVWILVSTARP